MLVLDIPPVQGALQFPACGKGREWVRRAVAVLQGEANRSADTHLINLNFTGIPAIPVYLKDESTHPTGSLKHRLARSLILYGICNGWIHEGTTLVEASSGSTAVSEAYFAKLLDLPFIAVMQRTTSQQKIDAITRLGGRCHFVDDPSTIYQVAEKLAKEVGGHYLDQFTNAERATDWRGNNNIAESMFAQMSLEPHPCPKWVVMNAGTGGTSATIGRYIRYRGLNTQLCVVDVENSAFYESYLNADKSATCATPSRVEGIGRPRVEPSFIAGVIDHMIKIPDAASLAGMHVLSERLSRRVGGSTGANFFGICCIAAAMANRGEHGSLVSVICDSGERYASTYYDASWLKTNHIDIQPYVEALNVFLDKGSFELPV